MKICWKFVVCGLALPLLFDLTAQAQDSDQQPGEISVWRAKRTLVTMGNYVYLVRSGRSTDFYLQTRTLQFASDTIKFDAKSDGKDQTVQFAIELKTPFKFKDQCYDEHTACELRLSNNKRLIVQDITEKKDYLVYSFSNSSVNSFCDKEPDPDACLHAGSRFVLFVKALNRLRDYALAHPNPTATEDFHQQAAAWRALDTKPSLAEAVRVYRLAAEDAIERKQLAEALNYYELGVQANPTWALGWYNAGLLAAEVSDFAAAAEHMQNYLELSPNADDAEAARDKMDLWKYKAGNSAIK